jgi:pimeloyl-ACP methyl ester carboxylesterase
LTKENEIMVPDQTAAGVSAHPPMYVERWGNGPALVLVHGGGAGGAANFQEQRPLAERWTLVLPDRPGHGRTPAHGRQDFETDAPLIADLLNDGAHLVGHSYGGVVALLAAALRPAAVRSLTVIEPAAFSVARGHAAVDELEHALIDLMTNPPEPEAFLRRFFALNGLPGQLPSPLPPALVASARAIPGIRGPWEATIPTEALRHAAFPKLIVSGGHSAAFECIADELARQIGAERAIISGAGHAVHQLGAPFNRRLEQFLNVAS